jgi:hypothetical protein
MAQSSVQRNAGQTVALSVTSTAHAAVLIADNTNDQINYTAFLNTGAAPIAVRWGTTDPGAPVFPVDGTNGDYVLAAAMNTPLILATPTSPFYLTAKSNSATAGILYVTPAADQS